MGQIICKPIGQEERLQVAYLLTTEEQRLLQAGTYGGLAAFVEELPVGILLYRLQGRLLHIVQVHVSGGYRRNGIGSTLVNTLHIIGSRKGLSLTASFGAAGQRDSIYRFFASFRQLAVRQTDGVEAFLEKETVAALCRKYQKKNTQVQHYFETGKKMQYAFCQELKQRFPLVAWELEEANGSYRRDLCCCKVEQDRIQAVCLIKEHKGELELSLLYTNAQKGALGAKVLLDSMGSLAEKDALPLWVAPVNQISTRILDQICPQYEIKKLFYTVCDMGNE